MSEKKYDFSNSDFRGAIMNFESTVIQNIGAASKTDQATKEELSELIRQLSNVLQQAPAEKSDDAEAVAETAEALVKTATADKPNKALFQVTATGLKQAAENIAGVMPIVLAIATQIITTAQKFVR